MTRPDWDPGWGAQLTGMFIPSRRTALAGSPALTTIRFLWLAFAYALVAFAVVLAFISPGDPSVVGWLPWGIVGWAAVIHLVAIPVVLRRMATPPPEAAEPDLLITFRDAMLLGVALSESIALIGFVAAFLTSSLWVYLMSLALALLGLVRVGPFQRTFERCDLRLQEQGSVLRMTDAWRHANLPNPPGPLD